MFIETMWLDLFIFGTLGCIINYVYQKLSFYSYTASYAEELNAIYERPLIDITLHANDINDTLKIISYSHFNAKLPIITQNLLYEINQIWIRKKFSYTWCLLHYTMMSIFMDICGFIVSKFSSSLSNSFSGSQTCFSTLSFRLVCLILYF